MNTIDIKNKERLYKIRKLGLCMLSTAIFGALFVASGANADAFTIENELQSSRSSSVNYVNESPTQTTNQTAHNSNEAQQAIIESFTLTTAPPAESRKTRRQVIAERKNKDRNKNVSSSKFSTQRIQASNYVEFGIYGASSRLFEDFDYDGFYQTFSVTFDADIYGQYSGERAYVFADLYLSRDGGPWELYFTTDNFAIVDDTSDDEFEVLTTLDVGYKTSHYDVLIDLYEAGYSDIVATISSEDIEDLYALPLESADRDEYVVTQTHSSEVLISAGSFSITGLLILIGAIGLRLTRK